MVDLISKFIPNVIDYQHEFLESISQTLQMMFYAGLFSFISGLILGSILVVTKEGNIMENRFINTIINTLVNTLRSIPMIILIAAMYPLTYLIVGTGIGVKGGIFPITVGATPFFIRQVDLALSGVDPGLIEAAQSMGVSPIGILFRVYLRESIPALAGATTITAISLLGLTTLGGAVGAGGLGSFVIRYGSNRYMYDIIYVSVFVTLIIVSIFQGIGNFVIKKTTH